MMRNVNTREFIALRWFYYICAGLAPSVYLFNEDLEQMFEKKQNKFSNIISEFEDMNSSGFTEEREK